MIGVFDSGIGGLSIYRAIKQKIPKSQVIFFADQAFTPYGEKTDIFLRNRGEVITQYFLKRGVTTIVIACNTATTSIPISYLRTSYPQIEFIGVEPPVKKLIESGSDTYKALFVTKATARSNSLEELMTTTDANNLIEVITPSEWVPLIESLATKEEMAPFIKKYLDPLQNKPNLVIGWGCTHYPFITGFIRDLYKERFDIIDVSEAVAAQVVTKTLIDSSPVNQDEFITTSDNTNLFHKQLRDLLSIETSVESIRL